MGSLFPFITTKLMESLGILVWAVSPLALSLNQCYDYRVFKRSSFQRCFKRFDFNYGADQILLSDLQE